MSEQVEKATDLDLYRQVFESAAEAIIVCDAAGDIVKVNPRTSELLGYSVQELIGSNIEMLIPQKYRHGHKAHTEGYNAHPKKMVMGSGRELSALKKDGTAIPIEISLNFFDQGENRYTIALLTDIAETKRQAIKVAMLNEELEDNVANRTKELNNAVAALKESQNLYASIARNFPNGTINVFDRDLNYIFVEGQELFRFGIRSEMLIGKNYIERLSPEIGPRIEEELKKVFLGEEVSFEIDHNDNNYVLNGVPLYDSEGSIHQILLVEKNITEQKNTEKEIMRSLEKERELNELKSRFVSMASHEFRTPLGTILSSVSLIERYSERSEMEKAQKHFQRVKSSVRTLTGVLNDFLSLDKLEEGKTKFRPEQFSLKDLAAEICEEITALSKSRQSITHNFTGDDLVYLDPQFTRIIMLNLMSNAIKYSDDDGQIEFNISSEPTVNIVVKDDGMGIPKEDQKHLFQRFFRANNASNIQGTGLGLNIVKQYVEMMDGNITFTSEKGKGTTFTVQINQSTKTTNQ